MDDTTFWRLIEQTRPADNDCDRHCEATTAALAKMEPEEILWFGHIFDEHHAEAYRADLWSVIYEIDGGCSDDGFMDFRAWLVMQGEDVFRTAMAAPDYLCEITLEDCAMSHEPFNYMDRYAYRRRTGEEEVPDWRPPGSRPHRWRPRPKGRFVKTDRSLRRRWPMLYRLLHDPPEIDPAWLKWQRGFVPKMAASVEKERRWSDLPVLADALADAGCEDRFILDHLRAGRQHARTCWVVNFLRGRR